MADNSFDLERVASRLGQAAADALDVERIAAVVVRRLRATQPWWRAVPLLQVAAVLALVAGGVVLTRFAPRQSPATPGAAVAIAQAVAPPALDALTTPELAQVLDSLALEAPPSTYVAHGLHDLNVAQLKELLALES